MSELKGPAKTRVAVVVKDPDLAQKINACLSGGSFDIMPLSPDPNIQQLLGAGDTDLIMVQHAPPDIDAHEVCRRARRVSDAPIIMVGNSRHATASVKALSSGADLYLSKGLLTPDHLAARVASLVRRSTGSG